MMDLCVVSLQLMGRIVKRVIFQTWQASHVLQVWATSHCPQVLPWTWLIRCWTWKTGILYLHCWISFSGVLMIVTAVVEDGGMTSVLETLQSFDYCCGRLWVWILWQ